MQSPSLRKLRFQIQVFAQGAADPFGQPQGRTQVLACYASITPERTHSAFANGAGYEEQTAMTIDIRYPNVPIIAGMRITSNDGRVFRVLAADDPDGKRRWFSIAAQKDTK